MSDEILHCPHGFNGTQEQLINALRYHPKRESLSSFHVKEAAVWLLEQKDAEIKRLQEFEWMYKDLCK